MARLAESRDSAYLISQPLVAGFGHSAQARGLYRLNRLRLIPDCNYRPVPLVPSLNPKTGAPLDLSYAALRSVSPVHIEYLHNMGIVASMSISVIRDGNLWGLISLHHKPTRLVPFETRVACDFLGKRFPCRSQAAKIGPDTSTAFISNRPQPSCWVLWREEENLIDGPVNHPDELLSFAEAGGAAVFEGECRLLGDTPPEETVWALTEWLTSQGQRFSIPNAELDQFAYAASHDLQLPLRMVKLYSQLLARRYEKALDQTGAEFISIIEQGVDRIHNLIEESPGVFADLSR